MSSQFVGQRRNERKNIGEEEQFTRGKELWKAGSMKMAR
jgi:hypothetical protein